jgi:hypothetical protein
MAAQRYARFAGVMYFFTVFDVTAVVILSRVTSGANFLDVAQNVAASELLYRVAMLLSIVGNLSTILLAAALYLTLRPIGEGLALSAMLFRLVESALGLVVVLLGFAALQVYLAGTHATSSQAGELGALAELLSRTSASGIDVSVLCFAVGSTLFFYLFWRSAYIPRILAGWGLAGSVLALAAFSGSLLFPQSSEVLRGIGALPIGVAELVVGAWLLIRGIRI